MNNILLKLSFICERPVEQVKVYLCWWAEPIIHFWIQHSSTPPAHPTNRQTTMSAKWLKCSIAFFLFFNFFLLSACSLSLRARLLWWWAAVILSKRHQLFAHIAHRKLAAASFVSLSVVWRVVCCNGVVRPRQWLWSAGRLAWPLWSRKTGPSRTGF